MSKHAELARKYLGATIRTTTFKVGKRSLVGYRALTELDVDEVVPLSRDARKDGLMLFRTATDDYELFAIPGIGPPEVVEIVKVGTHNRDGHDWRPVKSTIGKVFARAPFDVVLADAAGLIGVFHSKLSLQHARAIATLLEREVPTGLEAMEGELADLDVEEENEDDDLTPDED